MTAGIVDTSDTKVYWRAFAGCAALALLLRFTVFLNRPLKERSFLGLGFLVLSFSLVVALNFVAYRRVRQHLLAHHWEKGVELSRTRFNWPTMQWLYSTAATRALLP